ncbi:AsmA family protein [Acidihalobacter prosperus]
MKWIKRVFLIAIALLVLVVAGLTVFVMTFNPNDYKPQIEKLVKAKTGRTLSINGKIGLTLFPHLGLRLSNVSLSNPAGFGGQLPFARVGRLNLNVELLPLLHHKIVVDQVVLNSMYVNLVRKSDGQTNWQGLATTASSRSSSKVTKSKKPTTAGLVAGAPFALAVAAVNINDARITLDDQKVGRHVVLAPLNLSVGRLMAGHRPAPLKLSFHVESTKPALGLEVHLTAKLGVESAQSKYQLNQMNLRLSAKGQSVPKGALNIVAKGDLNADLSPKGHITLKPFEATLNGSKLTGDVAVTELTHPNINFTLSINHLNADQYLSSPSSAAKGHAGKQSNASNKGWSNKPLQVPLGEFRRIDGDGSLAIGQLVMDKLKLSQVKLRLKAQHGLLQVTQMNATLYGGALQGNVSLNARKRTPVMALKANLKGIQIGDLLKDYMGDSYLTGKTDFQANLHTQGISERAMVDALNGNIGIAVHNGSIRHSNLANQVQSALTKLQELRHGGSASAAGPETQFASLTATGQVRSGVIHNRDLKLNAIRFAANGRGEINLPNQRINYTLYFTQANGKGNPIPLQIRGPMRHPGYQIDFKSIAKDLLKQRLKQEKQNAGSQLKQRLEKALPGLKGLLK